MYRKKYRRKKKRVKKGNGLLGSDWPKIYRNLQPYLRNKKQKGGSIWSWAINKIARPNRVAKFLNNPGKFV